MNKNKFLMNKIVKIFKDNVNIHNQNLAFQELLQNLKRIHQ
jgi:hypothetical protein